MSNPDFHTHSGNRIPWTDEELSYLIQAWPNTPLHEIARHITRHSPGSIQSKAYRMGLKRDPSYSRQVRLQSSRLGAEAIRNGASMKQGIPPGVTTYGALHGAARVFLIDHRPPAMERRALTPSPRTYVSGSTMGTL
ncbi:hypothetical protein SAMN05192560_0765 [Methylobacillus rhizosphaerae]|uniref:Uncharacterized protein n=1 Tax=Methylobacillus rhizosphaerae TaxID=551994 RepID=A0A238YT00_9PROT|nr:SANT/Myb-like DNA-binding domain-containing protein [Methylobacillus rhizosphaerae]SNR73569.1 hypothetical protein SAMN05192560_0765 [Methylobacillus rhizosphaerae]